MDDEPVLEFASRAEWAAWLAAEHSSARAVWIRMPRKATGIPTVTYAEALVEALRFGWIDGQSRGIDDEWHKRRWTPRTARSKWSKRNVSLAEELIAAGRMEPAGLREVERARADGRWAAAYDAASTATVPDDLAAAFDAEPAARAFFDTLDSRNRFSVLHRIQDAKRPETRARRIEKYVAMLAAGEKIHP
ncbi:YdeI/OmpD-associated family protein [Actinocatenispora rupis]|nr:YdeI/OmpD-associated family protein [Actinocatenispora rupis]